MPDSRENKALMVRYILGQVSPEERAAFEERYFADSDLFEELVATENDLIDSYVRNELSGPGRFQFESRFLATPELRERVRLARSLAVYHAEPASPASSGWWKLVTGRKLVAPAFRFAFSAVILALLVWASWMTVTNHRLRRQIEQANIERASAERQQQELQHQIAQLSEQLQQIKASAQTQEIAVLGDPGRPVLSLSLSPGIPRGPGKLNVLPMSSDVSTALLLLKTGGGAYSSYRVSMETAEGKQVLKRDSLKAVLAASGRVVPVSIPSSALQRGDYILRLFGSKPGGHTEEINAYSFRVILH